MESTRLADQLVGIKRTGDLPETLIPVNLATERENQALVLVKPECFAVEDQSARLRLLFFIGEFLESTGFSVGGAVLFSGPWLADRGIIDRHYGYINRLSRGAGQVLSADDMTSIRAALDDDGSSPILGGHQVLKASPQLTPSSLEAIWQTADSVKVRGGLYVQKYRIAIGEEASDVIVVNGFHPAQLEHFTGPERLTVAIVVNSNLPWSVLRNRVLGNTYPGKAQPGSLRRKLFDRGQEFGLGSVGVSNNCVHLSAGPFEAMFEICNFLSEVEGASVAPSDCRQVAHLRSAGWTGDTDALILDPTISFMDGSESLFEITEGCDGRSAAFLLTDQRVPTPTVI